RGHAGRDGDEGDADASEPAGSQGHRRAGHHRVHARGAERGHRRAVAPRRAPYRYAAAPDARLGGDPESAVNRPMTLLAVWMAGFPVLVVIAGIVGASFRRVRQVLVWPAAVYSAGVVVYGLFAGGRNRSAYSA